MFRHIAGLFCAVFLTLAFTQNPATAGVKHWNTAVNNALWNDGNNWLPIGVPTATDTAVIDFAGTYAVSMNVNPTIAALRISGSTSGVQTVTGVTRTVALPNASSIG